MNIDRGIYSKALPMRLKIRTINSITDKFMEYMSSKMTKTCSHWLSIKMTMMMKNGEQEKKNEK